MAPGFAGLIQAARRHRAPAHPRRPNGRQHPGEGIEGECGGGMNGGHLLVVLHLSQPFHQITGGHHLASQPAAQAFRLAHTLRHAPRYPRALRGERLNRPADPLGDILPFDDHIGGGANFLWRLRGIAEIRDEDHTASANQQHSGRPGESGQPPDVRQVRDQERAEALPASCWPDRPSRAVVRRADQPSRCAAISAWSARR